jgi:transcriptional regulator with XRE-family HTH domain
MKEKSEFAVKVGTEIRRLRLERNRSQENFADDCGIARAYMGAIERGEKVISIVMARRIAVGLGVALSQLFAGIGE